MKKESALSRCCGCGGRADELWLHVRRLVLAHFAADVATALLVLAGRVGGNILGVVTVRVLRLTRGCPAVQRPESAGEALHGKAGLGPFSSRLARAIKSSQAGVDGSLVRFGSELVAGTAGSGRGPRAAAIVTVPDRIG